MRREDGEPCDDPERDAGRPAARLAADDVDRTVIRLVLAGEPNKVIARELGLPLGTVKWRLHRLYQRAGVRNRVEFVVHVTSRPGTSPNLGLRSKDPGSAGRTLDRRASSHVVDPPFAGEVPW